MPISVHVSLSTIAAFVLTLTRVGTALFLLPLPGFKDAPRTVRIVFVVATTFCVLPLRVVPDSVAQGNGAFLLAMIGETAAGLLLGLPLAFLHEAFQFAAQAVSMQSGLSIASVYDPASRADSGVFQVLTQLATGFLFFLFNIHHFLLRLLGRSFDLFAGDSRVWEQASLTLVLRLAGTMFATGLKMGLPLVLLLLLIELSLALLGRLHSQMQLLTLAFPIKTALSCAFLAALLVRWPSLYQHLARQMFERVSELIPF